MPYPQVVDYLNRARIFRVVCGHTPHGDAGLVVRTSRSGTEGGGELTCITMDTSYAAAVLGVDPVQVSTQQSPRIPARHGVAVTELVLYRVDDSQDDQPPPHARFKAMVHGVMADGQLYEAHPDDPDAAIVAGDQVGEGWYVKGRRIADGYIILCRNLPVSEGRPWGAIENKYVAPAESMTLLRENLGVQS